MDNQIVKDALARSIAARLLMCSEEELRAIDRMMIAVEKRRDIRSPLVTEVSRTHPDVRETEPPVDHTERGQQITDSLRDLRESMTYRPRRQPFTVIDGGAE